MTETKVNFQQVKGILLNKTPEEISEIIRSTDLQDDAMFLFWALDYLDQHQKEIPVRSKETLQKNREILDQAKKAIIAEILENSLKEYSAGFVLGTLEFCIRQREAQIDLYQEYTELINKIYSWSKLGFPNEEFQKQWEKRINDIQEIQDWMKTKANEWFPVIIPVYRSGKFKKPPSVILKAFRKGRGDDIVFQILAAQLHSNPILDKRIKTFCKENQISVVEKSKLIDIMQLLANETKSKKVRSLARLLIDAKKKKESE